MKKMIRALCFALTMVAASASASSFDRCDVVGSYISVFDTSAGHALDQIQLHAAGTAWEYESLNDPIITDVLCLRTTT